MPPTTDPAAVSPQSNQQTPAPTNGLAANSAGNAIASAMPHAAANAFPTTSAGSNSAARWKATGSGKWRNGAGSSSVSAPPSEAGTNTSTNTNPNAPGISANAQATDADAPVTNNDPTPGDPSQQTNSANPNSAGGALALMAATAAADALNPANATSGQPTLPTKDATKDGDQTGSADAGNAAPGVNQPASDPQPVNQQPVAAALVLNVASDAPPVTANVQSASTINGQPKPRARLALPSAGDQNSSAPDAKDATATQTTTSAQPTADDQANGAGSSGSAADGNAANPLPSGAGADQSQAQTQANNSAAVVLAQTTAAVAGDAGRAVHGDAVASTTAGQANAQTANGAASPNVLPSFGFLAAAMTAGAATTPAATANAAVPLAGLAVAIASRAQAGSNQFDIRLDPPELGRIDVRLDVDSNGQVTSHVTVDRADTLQLLQSQQPQLERALEQAGLKTTDNGLQFTLRDQSFAGQNGSGGGQQNTNTAQLVIPDPELAPVDTSQIYSRWNLGSGLDIRV